MNKISFQDLIEPFKEKKKFSFLILFSIFLIFIFEFIVRQTETKIYVTNVDLMKVKIISQSNISDYTDKRINPARKVYWDIFDLKEFRSFWNEVISNIKKTKKNSLYIDVKKIKTRDDRIRIQISSKDSNINKNFEELIYKNLNVIIRNIYLESLKKSLEHEDELLIFNINRIKNDKKKKLEIKANLEFIEEVLGKKLNPSNKNKLMNKYLEEYKELELEKINDLYTEWTNGHKKAEEKIKLVDFLESETYEKFISIEKTNVEIKYVLQFLSFIISYALILFYSFRQKNKIDA